MRIAYKCWGAILQYMRQSDWCRTRCSHAKRCSTVVLWTRATPYSIAGELVAGQRDSAFRGGGNDSDSWPGTAFLDRLGSGRAFLELAVHVSAIWTLRDRWNPGVFWGCAPALGVGAISTRTLGARAWLGAWIFGAAAAAVWHGARHLHGLGVVAPAIEPGV